LSNLVRNPFRSEAFDEIQKTLGARIGIDEDETALGHLMRCEGCDNCDWLMRFYSACDECGHWMYNNTPSGYYYNPETGEALCQACEPKEADL
jgi:hypothetical protein